MNTLDRLREFVLEYYDIEELRDLCFKLGVDYDSLRGEGKAGKTRELVLSLRRQGRLDELLQVLSETRRERFDATGLSTDAAFVDGLYRGAPAHRERRDHISDLPDTVQQLRKGKPKSKSIRYYLFWVGIGAVLVAVIGAVFLLRPIVFPEPKPTATATVTPQTPTMTSVLPPDTPTPTQTPIPTSSALLFEEDFEGEIRLRPQDPEYWRVATDETGNHFYCVKAPQEGYTRISLGSSTWEDYVLKTDIIITDSSTEGTGNVVVRASSSSAYVFEFSDRRTELNKEWYSPFYREYLALNYQGFVLDKWETARVEARGSEISVVVDDLEVLRANDSDFDRGSIVLGAGWEVGVCFDNIRVTALGIDE